MKKYKLVIQKSRFKISASMWNNKFELPDGSYSALDMIDNPSLRIYSNKIENIIIFKIKTGYYLEIETSKTMKLLGSTKSKTKMVKMCPIQKLLKYIGRL